MMDFGDYIDRTKESILEEKNKLDQNAFLKFLKEELNRKGIKLTIKRKGLPFPTDNIVISNIVGVELDLSDYDKKKDAEIEKYKKAFESAKCESDTAVSEYQNEIDRLKSTVQELEKLQEELPFEPIHVVEYLIDRTIEVKNTFPALQGGKTSHVSVHDVSELRQIAEHLLVYCKHHSEE